MTEEHNDFNERDREDIKILRDQVRENNKILRSMQSAARNKFFLGVIKWIVLVLIALYVWSILEPVYQSLRDSFVDAQDQYNETTEGFSAMFDAFDNFSGFFQFTPPETATTTEE